MAFLPVLSHQQVQQLSPEHEVDSVEPSIGQVTLQYWLAAIPLAVSSRSLTADPEVRVTLGDCLGRCTFEPPKRDTMGKC